MKPGKLTLPELAAMKRRGDKIVMVTAYDAPGARLAEQAGIDILLVGDTAGMVVLGHESTVPVTMDEMLFLTRAVARTAERPLVVGDMPFGSYHVSDEDAVGNAIRFVKEGGADVVKLEGAGPSLSRVRSIVAAGIGVMGHVGLTPQSETILGGFRTQGRTASKARQLLADALALEAAGCFAVVLEAVPVPVAARITEALTVPTIGIGAGSLCDGQVLVYHDLLGLTEGRAPRFVKRYANLAEQIRGALSTYADEVRSAVYPADEHTYSMPDDELELFSGASESFVANDRRVDRSVQTDARANPTRPDDDTPSGASESFVANDRRVDRSVQTDARANPTRPDDDTPSGASESFVANDRRVDRSVQTDARAKPTRPDDGTASGASESFVANDRRVDRSVQTDARAKPTRPDDGTASGASGDVEHAHRDR